MSATKRVAKKATKKAAVRKHGKKPSTKNVITRKAARKATLKKALAKKAAKKAPAKKAAKTAPAKKAAKKKIARKPNAAFMKPLTPQGPLAAIVGSMPMPRTEVTSKIWAYIKKNKLQDAVNRRMINPDEKLAAVLGKKGKGNDPGPSISMFAMTKLISKHLK
jgi:chromatin remodeling complex protein RSC6